ncbi:MAG: 50S ribosomal protein L24 [Phycisphaeraceae bacterium]
MARHIKQGDLVQVIAGNDRGKTGHILRILVKKDQVVVEGVNRRHRHVKPSQKNPQGGRIEKEMPVHISNVLPVSPSTGKATRVRFQTKADGTKVRVAVRGGDELSVLKKVKK